MTDATVVNPERTESALIDIAIEGWRLARLFSRVLARLDAADAARNSNQLRYFLKRVEDVLASAELRLVNLEGQAYDAGLPATALNVSDFSAADDLTVEQMIEPVIMGPSGLRRTGVVILRKTTP